MSQDQTSRRFFFALLFASMVLLALVIRPMATALFMAVVLAAVLGPLHRRLTKRVRGKRTVASGVLVFAAMILLVGPVVGLSAFLIREGADGVRFISETVRGEGVAGLIERLPESLEHLATRALEWLSTFGQDLDKQIGAQSGKAAAAVGAAVAATGSVVFQTTMMLIALFFLLVHGEELVAWLDGIAPMRRGQIRELLGEFKKVSFAVIVSTLITSAVQAGAALVGYLIARVPHPIFFASLTFFVAFIPAIGAASVCLLAALILLATGHPYMALFLAIWGLVIVGLVDNVVKPLLIQGDVEMGGALVFFALIGGLGAFGAVGLLIGPLVVALFLALMRIYRRDFRADTKAQ